MKRTRNAFRNTAVSLGGYVLIFLFGIAVRRLFLDNLNFDNLGYESLFNMILQTINTLDFGAGSVLLYRLYREISSGSESQARRVLAVFSRLYRWISLLILLAGLAIMPFLRFLIREQVSDWGYVYTIYLILLLGNVGLVYLTFYRLSLQASQRVSDAVTIETVFRISFQIIKGVIILKTHNFILYTLASVACNLLAAVFVAVRSKARHPELFLREDVSGWYRDKHLKTEILGASVLRFTQTASFLTDAVLISAVLGIRTVALYTNYTLIGSSVLAGFVSALNPVSGSAGNYANTEQPEACYSMFRMIDLISFLLASFVFTSLCVLFQPVISLLFGVQFLLPYSFVVVYGLSIYLILKDNSIKIFRDTVGKYSEQRKWALSAAAVNIAVSLAGIALWGITGVLIGTVASALISEIGDYTIACRHRFFQPLGKNLLRSYSLLALAAAEMTATVLLCKLLPYSTGGVALRCLICLVLPNGINLLLFRKTSAFAQVMAYLKKIFNLVFHHVDPDAVEP